MKKTIAVIILAALFLSGCGPVEEPVNYVPDSYTELMPPDLEQTIKKAMEEEGKVFAFEKYYGTYGDCVVWFSVGINSAFMTKEIAGYKFIYPTSFTIHVYRKGKILSLEEAYKNLWLNQNQIKLLAEYHAASTEWEYSDHSASDPPASDPPASEPPASEPPASEPPATEPPATEPPVTEPPASEPECTAELIAMEEMFKWSKENWYNYALTCYFEDATKLELGSIFHNGFSDIQLNKQDPAVQESLKDVPGYDPMYDIAKLPIDRMDAVLQKYFGVTYAQCDLSLSRERIVYYEPHNCCYMFHNDANSVMDFTFEKMETNADGTVKVYYSMASYAPCPTGVLTLKLVGDTYQVLSNQPQ